MWATITDELPLVKGVRQVLTSQRADDGLVRPLAGERYCRATVGLPNGNRLTLQLPALVPTAEVVQLVMRDVRATDDILLPAVWTLGEVGRAGIPLDISLFEAGITDGAVLEVRDVASDAVGVALAMSADQIVAEVADEDRSARWSSQLAIVVCEPLGYLVFVVAVLAGLLLEPAGVSRTTEAIAAVFSGMLLLGVARWRHRSARNSVAVIAAWSACVVLGAGAFCAPNPSGGVLRTSLGVTAAVFCVVLAVPVIAVIGPAVALAAASVTAAVLVLVDASAVSAAATLGALGAVAAGLGPALAVRLSALAVADSAERSDVDPALWGATTFGPLVRPPIRARALMQFRTETATRHFATAALARTRYVQVCACAIAVGCVVSSELWLAQAASPYAWTEALALAVVLLMRAVLARPAADGAVLLGGGIAAAVVITVMSMARWEPSGVGIVVGVLLGAILAVTGVAGSESMTRRGRQPDEPRRTAKATDTESALAHRVARVLSGLALIVAVVAATGTFGAFEHFWNLGRSL